MLVLEGKAGEGGGGLERRWGEVWHRLGSSVVGVGSYEPSLLSLQLEGYVKSRL